MDTFTKITGLTGMNVDALRQAVEVMYDSDGPGNVVLTKTTVTFPWTADRTMSILQGAKNSLVFLGHSSRSHPVSSLNAVIRKTARIAASQDAV